ncbi:MAG: protease inhibitor I42 family protein, partial [Desulfobacterales bacterium]|nr:protease inhibitor I42 family protein [Desulfobacterales bacterium]
MKRIGWTLLFFLLCSSMAAAGPLERFYSDNDADKLIDLDEDSVAVIELPSNPSTGHGWRVKGALGKNVEILGSEFESSQPGLLGAPGKEKIYVVGMAKGRSEA